MQELEPERPVKPDGSRHAVGREGNGAQSLDDRSRFLDEGLLGVGGLPLSRSGSAWVGPTPAQIARAGRWMGERMIGIGLSAGRCLAWVTHVPSPRSRSPST